VTTEPLDDCSFAFRSRDVRKRTDPPELRIEKSPTEMAEMLLQACHTEVLSHAWIGKLYR